LARPLWVSLPACRIHVASLLCWTATMATFVPCNRDRAFPLLPDLKAWLPEDDVAHVIVAAVERVHRR
jgi:hypothetical protein